jgi:RimJ/RimL family protein N-acetyltransferase
MIGQLWALLTRRPGRVTNTPRAPSGVVIETERLLLRELTEGDLPALMAYHSDPEVLRYQPAETAKTAVWLMVRNARQHIWRRRREYYLLGIVREGRLIGECTLWLVPSAAHPGPSDTATIGFILHREHWNLGYATETGQALLRFAFVDLRLACVYSGCLEENAASRRVLEKLGMAFQRTARGFPGSPPGVESLVFRILSDEWIASNPEAADPPIGCCPS